MEAAQKAIGAAKTAGVKTIIYTNLMFRGETGMKSVGGLQQAHIETAKLLEASRVDHVIVREGLYAES